MRHPNDIIIIFFKETRTLLSVPKDLNPGLCSWRTLQPREVLAAELCDLHAPRVGPLALDQRCDLEGLRLAGRDRHRG